MEAAAVRARERDAELARRRPPRSAVAAPTAGTTAVVKAVAHNNPREVESAPAVVQDVERRVLQQAADKARKRAREEAREERQQRMYISAKGGYGGVEGVQGDTTLPPSRLKERDGGLLGMIEGPLDSLFGDRDAKKTVVPS